MRCDARPVDVTQLALTEGIWSGLTFGLLVQHSDSGQSGIVDVSPYHARMAFSKKPLDVINDDGNTCLAFRGSHYISAGPMYQAYNQQKIYIGTPHTVLTVARIVSGGGSAFSAMKNEAPYRGFDLAYMNLIPAWRVYLIDVYNSENIYIDWKVDGRTEVRMLGWTYDGSATAAGVHIYSNGYERNKTLQQDTLTPASDIYGDTPYTIGARADSPTAMDSMINANLGDTFMWKRALSKEEICYLFREYMTGYEESIPRMKIYQIPFQPQPEQGELICTVHDNCPGIAQHPVDLSSPLRLSHLADGLELLWLPLSQYASTGSQANLVYDLSHNKYHAGIIETLESLPRYEANGSGIACRYVDADYGPGNRIADPKFAPASNQEMTVLLGWTPKAVGYSNNLFGRTNGSGIVSEWTWSLMSHSTGEIAWGIGDGSRHDYHKTAAMHVGGNTYNLALSVPAKGKQIRFWVNGEQFSEIERTTEQLVVSSDPYFFGMTSVNGLIHYAAFYSRALSAAEVAEFQKDFENGWPRLLNHVGDESVTWIPKPVEHTFFDTFDDSSGVLLVDHVPDIDASGAGWEILR